MTLHEMQQACDAATPLRMYRIDVRPSFHSGDGFVHCVFQNDRDANFYLISREAMPKLLEVVRALDYVSDKGMITSSDDSDHDALKALVAARKALEA